METCSVRYGLDGVGSFMHDCSGAMGDGRCAVGDGSDGLRGAVDGGTRDVMRGMERIGNRVAPGDEPGGGKQQNR